MPGGYSHTSRATGTVVTDTIYNGDHTNHITNQELQQTDDYSATNSQMQSTTDPYPASAESLATAASGEIERLRYLIKQLGGQAQWYIDPAGSVADLLGILGTEPALSNGTDATNDIDISAGSCPSNDAAIADKVILAIPALTKQLDAVYAAGTGA